MITTHKKPQKAAKITCTRNILYAEICNRIELKRAIKIANYYHSSAVTYFYTLD